MNALKLAAEGYGRSLPDFLARVERVVHGTTVSTNALLEGKHATVGLICTHGFRDILTLREAPRKPPFQWRLTYPEPFVPRIRTRGVRGRIDATGAEHTPLEEDDVSRGGRGFSEAGRGGGRGLPAVVGGERQPRAARGRDRQGRLARGPGDAQPPAQPDCPRVSPYGLCRHRRCAQAGGERLCPRARPEPARERLRQRADDRKLPGRHDAAGRNRRAADLQRDVGADSGAGRRQTAHGCARSRGGRHGRHLVRRLRRARRPARHLAGGDADGVRHVGHPQGGRALGGRRRRLHRPCRCGRVASRGAGERRRGSRPRLLRPRWHAADRDRRRRGARHHRPRLLPRRQDAPRQGARRRRPSAPSPMRSASSLPPRPASSRARWITP